MTLDTKRLRELCDAATPGPWELRSDRNEQQNVYSGEEWIAILPHQCVASIERQREQDATFIAAARTAVPELLDEVERLRVVVVSASRSCRGDTHVEVGGYDDRCNCGRMRRR